MSDTRPALVRTIDLTDVPRKEYNALLHRYEELQRKTSALRRTNRDKNKRIKELQAEVKRQASIADHFLRDYTVEDAIAMTTAARRLRDCIR